MLLRRVGRRLLERVAAPFGYTLKAQAAPLRGYSTFLAQCRSRGLSVETVFDAGVGTGTPWLYESFRQKKLVLFEPLSQFVPTIEGLRDKYDIDLHRTALGAESAEVTMRFPKEFATAGSLKTHGQNLLEAIEREGRTRTYITEDVKISKLDDLNTYAGPYCLKIDVEGFELELLKGAEKTLTDTELVIVELSLMERYENGCTFLDVANFLAEQGFVLYEIVEMFSRTPTGSVSFVDAAFVPAASKLREF